jgi:Zn-dependent protease with chaperone function
MMLWLLMLLSPSTPAAAGQELAPPAAAAVAAEAMNDGPVAVPEPTDLAIQRFRSGNILWCVNRLWAVLVPAVFLFTGLSAKLRTWAGRIGRFWYLQFAIYFAAFMIITDVFYFPLAFYQGFVREHAYGLSNQTFGKWFHDSLLGLGVTIVMGIVFLWVPYLLIRKSPRRWWLYAGLLVPPFLFFEILIFPVLIDPLFNRFEPMKNKELEKRILATAERSGIEGSRVYEVNKSVDTKAVNAYVTGFLQTKRIVLWDTLLNKLDEDEVVFVVGHEMGHYVLNHIVYGVIMSSVGCFIGLYLLHRVSAMILLRFHNRFGFDSLGDIASFPLVVLLLGIFAFAASPIALAVSRHDEREADRFGIELTRLNRAAATGFVKLQQENLGVPWHSLLYKLWRDTHPPVGERIVFFNSYKPWQTGQPLRYEGRFREESNTPGTRTDH